MSGKVVIEVRAGVGGEEAALWAAELFGMYQKFATARGWAVDVVSASFRGKGAREIVAIVAGKGVDVLIGESGVHRIQRVSVTEKRGRVHTSAATVAVLPVAERAQVQIAEKDLRVDTYRGSGAGGQHRNKTDSAVRITHLPTGLVVTCEDERSQFENKERAMIVLGARLLERSTAAASAERDRARRSQIGEATRAEKRRTYDVPEDTVIDHRTGRRVPKVKHVLNGGLEKLVA